MKRPCRCFHAFFSNSNFEPKNPITTMAALSSFFLPNQHRSLRQNFTPALLPRRTVNYSTKATSTESPPPPPTPPPEKKSFAVATGELFLGLAARLIVRRDEVGVAGGEGNNGSGQGVAIFPGNDRTVSSWWRRRSKEDVASVVQDPVQPDVVWEQREKDVEAERERKAVTSPGFSFSAAGLLFPYHLGVAKYLLENGYIKETTPLAGSSAGAIVCAVIASGATMEEALKATKILSDNCRLKGTAFRLGAVLRGVLEEFLPDDAHIRSSGRVRVAVTQLLWRPRGLLVDQFDSKEDLINAVITSSFIPGYLAPRPATMFRNRICIDGGLTLFMPPTSAAQTVRVCAFPASRLGLQGIGISPDCNPENRASPRELFNWALEPAEDHILDKLFELGYLDAAVWAKQNPVENIVHDDSSFAASVPMQ
ncbi:OLC1v1002485C1 [Oldenlandia corymbosa var. corymbosa]|uniref:Patatin n=1 Tax=Oldenlandia corymbosa var. corymbosa TaxID=529605 RepID=A0AAV1D7S9_OLDCO|nr:OLC1v1002485C1 [Oldenlandia corymbosa var. corymbosa]